MQKELQYIAFGISKICMQHVIRLDVEWEPRSDNERADYLSRIVDDDDWGISFESMGIIT